jgi:catechol 2,3-dioxygenase-like lactoylglutathione lyase family enzyme
MDRRISLITLGVRDLARARRFYEALGWQPSRSGGDGVAFYQAGGMVLALFGWDALAADVGLPDDGSGFRGISLAQNQPDKDSVDRVLAEAIAAGATLVKAAHDVFWGGYSGYFADPDGHLWEIAWNPFWPLAGDGSIRLPD